MTYEFIEILCNSPSLKFLEEKLSRRDKIFIEKDKSITRSESRRDDIKSLDIGYPFYTAPTGLNFLIGDIFYKYLIPKGICR